MVPIILAGSALVTGADPAEPGARRDLLVWGYGSSRPTELPGRLSPILVAAGGGWNLAVDQSGDVWTWSQFLGLKRVQGVSGVTAAAVSHLHFLAVPSDGTVWGWGWNGSGQLGDGNSGLYNTWTPVQAAGLADAVAVSAGAHFSLALLEDGTVWSWGDNQVGQLGNGTTQQSSTPVQVEGLSDVIGISAGWYHGLAVRSDGTVWWWGQMHLGRSYIPQQISGLDNFVAVAGGHDHSVGLRSDGTVWAWGGTQFGQTGHASQYPGPVDNLDDAIAIAAGKYHSAALLSDGTVRAWGLDQSGQLGGSSASDSVPGVGSVSAIAAGDPHTVAVGRLPSGECYEGMQVTDREQSVEVSVPLLFPQRIDHYERLYILEEDESVSICFRFTESYEATVTGGKLVFFVRRPDPSSMFTLSSSDACRLFVVDTSTLGKRITVKVTESPPTICFSFDSVWTSIHLFDPGLAQPELTMDP